MKKLSNTARSFLYWWLTPQSTVFMCREWEGDIFTEITGEKEWIVRVEHWINWVVNKREPILVTRNWDDFSIVERACQECVQNDTANPRKRTTEILGFSNWDSITQYIWEDLFQDLEEKFNSLDEIIEDNYEDLNDNKVDKTSIKSTEPTENSTNEELTSAQRLWLMMWYSLSDLVTYEKNLVWAINETYNRQVWFFKYQQIDPVNEILVPNWWDWCVNAFSLADNSGFLESPTEVWQYWLTLKNWENISLYKANSSLAWVYVKDLAVSNWFLFSEDFDNTPKYWLGWSWKEFWATIDMTQYYTKSQTYSNQEAVASMSEVIIIDETSYELTRMWRIIYCTDETYQALYDWGILDNEPYASMIFFTSEEEE
jgi:hypothetical protein